MNKDANGTFGDILGWDDVVVPRGQAECRERVMVSIEPFDARPSAVRSGGRER